MDPTKFCPFFTTSFDLMDPKISCDLMDRNQFFPLSKPHVFWWTHYATKTSCVLVDPKHHVIRGFSGSIKPHEVFGSTKTQECTKNSCDLMDPNFQPHWVQQTTWGFFSCGSLQNLFWVKQCFVMPNTRYFTPKPNLNKPNLTRPNLITLT